MINRKTLKSVEVFKVPPVRGKHVVQYFVIQLFAAAHKFLLNKQHSYSPSPLPPHAIVYSSIPYTTHRPSTNTPTILL